MALHATSCSHVMCESTLTFDIIKVCVDPHVLINIQYNMHVVT